MNQQVQNSPRKPPLARGERNQEPSHHHHHHSAEKSMNEVQSAPRIDASQVGEWQDQVVRIVGRVEQGQSPVAILGCGESGQIRVQVKMSPGNLYNSTYVEVIGRVVSDGIEEYGSFDLGDNFDLANYQQALNFANGQYINLFR